MTMFGSQWLANAGATYEIEQSIRFNDGDTSYMQRIPGSAGNDNTFTISFWSKRGSDIATGIRQDGIIGAGDSADVGGYGRNDAIGFFDDVIQIFTFSGFGANLRTTAVYRDPGSWYHFVVRYDDTQSTSTDRVRLYVNSVQVTSFSPATYPDQNEGCSFNAALLQRIGANTIATDRNFDGYLAEMVMIDGTSLGPDSFGEINSDTGQWVPIDVSGLTFGTNGFHITGANSDDLGEDFSGNNNDFATTNLAATDQLSDSPTNNWCVLNSVSLKSTATLSDGNLTLSNTSTGATTGTLATPSSGKWYFEVKFDSQSAAVTSQSVGVVKAEEAYITGTTGGGIYFFTTGLLRVEGDDSAGSSWGSAWGVGETIGVAIDLDANKIWFAIDNTWQASGDPSAGTDPAASGFSSEPYVALIRNGNASRTTGWTANFGQNAFAYTPPTDFLALNSANLPDPAIEDPSAYFQTTLYEGDGSTQSIDQDGNSTFSPNFVWIKNRDAADAHALFDTVRGATEVLSSNSTAAEATNDDTLTAFESDGFAIGDDVIVNTNAESYVAWQWAEGATPGLDIIAYTGNGSNRTIAHNLGVKPGMFIVKARDRDDANWGVYHSAVGATKSLFLQSSGAAFDSDEYFNDTEPTASVFTLGVNAQGNTDTKTYIAYVFAPVEGFSAFGSYEGNTNVNGPMANLGFRPAWLLIKNADATGSWLLFDTARDTYNAVHKLLFGQLANVEDTSTAYLDIVSNGFKIRSTGNGTNNAVTYVYAAFAENPFKTANAR